MSLKWLSVVVKNCPFMAMIMTPSMVTGVRDYIHVVDLAKAHLCALNNPYLHKAAVLGTLAQAMAHPYYKSKHL